MEVVFFSPEDEAKFEQGFKDLKLAERTARRDARREMNGWSGKQKEIEEGQVEDRSIDDESARIGDEAHMLIFMSSWLQTPKFGPIHHLGMLLPSLLVDIHLEFCFSLIFIFGSSLSCIRPDRQKPFIIFRWKVYDIPLMDINFGKLSCNLISLSA